MELPLPTQNQSQHHLANMLLRRNCSAAQLKPVRDMKCRDLACPALSVLEFVVAVYWSNVVLIVVFVRLSCSHVYTVTVCRHLSSILSSIRSSASPSPLHKRSVCRRICSAVWTAQTAPIFHDNCVPDALASSAVNHYTATVHLSSTDAVTANCIITLQWTLNSRLRTGFTTSHS